MSAHPMITPLEAIPPEQIAADYSEDAAALYRIIWDNTIAHLKAPPEVSEERVLFSAGSEHVAAGWIRPIRSGWLQVFPKALGSDQTTLPIGSETAIPQAPLEAHLCQPIPYICESDARTVDSLLQWLDAMAVASPGRLAELLEESETAGWIAMEDGKLQLTSTGRNQLKAADAAGYASIDAINTARWRLLCDEYIAGDISLDKLIDDSSRLLGIKTPGLGEALDQLVVGGHSATDAYALRDRQMLKRSTMHEYPASMDPERLLPKDHPLRTQREELEKQLSGGQEHQWCLLSARERAAIRMGALTSPMDDVAREKLLDDVLFDARWRWLIGLGANDPAPSLADAFRAYNGWRENSPNIAN